MFFERVELPSNKRVVERVDIGSYERSPPIYAHTKALHILHSGCWKMFNPLMHTLKLADFGLRDIREHHDLILSELLVLLLCFLFAFLIFLGDAALALFLQILISLSIELDAGPGLAALYFDLESFGSCLDRHARAMEALRE